MNAVHHASLTAVARNGDSTLMIADVQQGIGEELGKEGKISRLVDLGIP